jgi:uncharacterized membrane protein HdeD (DUF308 family)
MLALFARSWWILTLRGIVALFYSLIVFIWASATPIVLMLLLTMYAFVDGILGVIAAFENHEQHGQRGLFFPMGLVGIAAGIVALVWPSPKPSGFVYLIAGWALLAGMLEAIAGIRLRRLIPGGWLMSLKGVSLAVFGLLLIAWEYDLNVAPNHLAAFGIAASGALAIIAAFRVGNWEDEPLARMR